MLSSATPRIDGGLPKVAVEEGTKEKKTLQQKTLVGDGSQSQKGSKWKIPK